MTSPRLRVVVGGLCLFVAGGCGGGDSKAVTKPAAVPTTVAHSQTITVTPSTGLKNGQTVHVEARGFTPNQTGLGVVQCVKDAIGEGDCNLGGLKVVASDATGAVSADFTVVTGPIGGNARTCSATDRCGVSVTQLSTTPGEVATADIKFA